MRQYRTIKLVAFDHQKTPEGIEKLDFHWWWGASGSGKSRTAREENPDADLKCINKWWGNYEGKGCVIIDEWEPCRECLAAHLHRWCDHHPFSAEYKGGTMKLRPKKIILTSNYSIGECFPTVSGAAHQALIRRFNVRAFE